MQKFFDFAIEIYKTICYNENTKEGEEACASTLFLFFLAKNTGLPQQFVDC